MDGPLRVSIIGIGNVLLRDDAVGPHVIAWLEAMYDFGEGVELCDAGTPGLDFLVRLSQTDAMIAVDAVRASAPAGTVVMWGREDIMRCDGGLRLSPHDPALGHALCSLALAGAEPREALLIGIVPKTVEPGVGLSAEVRPAIARAGAAVVDKVRQLGLAVEPRAEQGAPNAWWER